MNTLSISQLRQNTAAILAGVVKKQEPRIIMQRSSPKAVLVDFAYFRALEEAVIDLTDALEADRAKNEPTALLSTYVKKRWGKSTV